MTPSEATQALLGADDELHALGPTPFPLPLGALAPVVAGALTALERGEWWVPGLRERVGGVLRDVPLERLVEGTRGARPYKIAPPSPSPALRALYTVGLALATGRPALCHLGVGALADGALTEALNLGALHPCRAIFVLAIHPLGDGAPLGPQTAADPDALVRAYGWAAIPSDAPTAQAVHDAVQTARAHDGPAAVIVSLPSPS